jgi:hypothetical protein
MLEEVSCAKRFPQVHLRIRDKKREFLKAYGRNVNIELLPERDAIALVAAEIATEAWILCFDEFQVCGYLSLIAPFLRRHSPFICMPPTKTGNRHRRCVDHAQTFRRALQQRNYYHLHIK